MGNTAGRWFTLAILVVGWHFSRPAAAQAPPAPPSAAEAEEEKRERDTRNGLCRGNLL